MNADQRGFERVRWEFTGQILGVFFGVHNELGGGFLESVYHAAVIMALEQAGLPLATQVPIEVGFRGQRIGTFRADLVVNNAVLVELKAGRGIEDAHRAQVLNYLRATDLEIGLILNFGSRPEFARLVYANSRKGQHASRHDGMNPR